MTAALQFTFNFHTVVCANCGMSFAFDKTVWQRRYDDHKAFYCPNGHNNYYNSETNKERLEKELSRVRMEKTWAEQRADARLKEANRQERKARAFKAVATKLKKRVGNGVCPCCNRTFQNVMAHMKTKHPKYKDGKK